MTIPRPRLPQGDRWEVERVTFERSKTMRVIWKRPSGGGYFHVAARNFRPEHCRWAFLIVYWEGLRRLASDERKAARDIRDDERFRRAYQIATSSAPKRLR